MQSPTWSNLYNGFRGLLTEIYNLWPLVTRLAFTFVFWSGTFAFIRFGPMLRSPVLDQPLRDLGNLVIEQVNPVVIGLQLLVLIFIIGVLAIAIERLTTFRHILWEEAFRLYYNAILSAAGYSLIFGRWVSLKEFLFIGIILPALVVVVIRQFRQPNANLANASHATPTPATTPAATPASASAPAPAP